MIWQEFLHFVLAILEGRMFSMSPKKVKILDYNLEARIREVKGTCGTEYNFISHTKTYFITSLLYTSHRFQKHSYTADY